MANTTKDKLLAMCPEFVDVPKSVVDTILVDVAQDVTSSVYGALQERAQRYLAAHYLTLMHPGQNKNTAGGITKEKVGDVEAEYRTTLKKTNRYDETAYGRMFNNIRNGVLIGFKVVKP